MANKVAELLLKVKTAGEDSLKSITVTLGDIMDLAGRLWDSLAMPINEFKAQEEATNSLTRALINNGIYSKELKDDYLKQASALQSLTTFGDEQIIAAQAVLQTQIGQTKITKELTQAVLDFATVQKMDAASAAEAVGKAIGTSTNALARYGIEVNSSSSSAEKLSQVVDGLNQKFGGQAEAAAGGLGSLIQLKNATGELVEEIGGRMAPLITLIAKGLKSLAEDTSNTSTIFNGFSEVLQFLAKAGIGIIGVFEGVGKVIGNNLGAQVTAVMELMKGNVKNALKTVWEGIKGMGTVSVETYENMANRMAAVDQAFNAGKAASLAEEETLLKESLERKRIIEEENRLAKNNKAIEDDIAQKEFENALLVADQEKKLALVSNFLDRKIAATTKAEEKNRLLRQKYAVLEAQSDMTAKRMEEERQTKFDKETEKNRTDTLNRIASLSNSSNSRLAAIGKAAALTQIAIDTPVAIGKALAAFPPPINFAAAGAVGAAMAVQAARIAGVPLAEGGIIKATPGGVPAIIGEGGQDEAVIPLDRAGEFGLGGGRSSVTVIVNGGLLGDEASAYELAKAIDRNLLKLRQNNESVAFDSRVV